MNSWSCNPLLFATLLTSSSSASTAIISRDWKTPGDGLLTYDDVNQREWLDLSLTQLSLFSGETFEMRTQQVILQTGAGGQFEGFSLVSLTEVRDLLLSAGAVLSDDQNQRSAQLFPAVFTLVELFDPPRDTSLIAMSAEFYSRVTAGRKAVALSYDYIGPPGQVTGRGQVVLPFAELQLTAFQVTTVFLARTVPETVAREIAALVFFVIFVLHKAL